MKVIFLGTGTSQGVPVIGCKCSVCTSDNPKNTRLRPSIIIENDSTNILIDASNDFRAQMLKYNITRLDGVLLTHFHFDHISGIDDMRQFNFIQNSHIQIYANEDTLKEVKLTFRYAFDKNTQKGGGLPQINLNLIEGNKKFFINNVEIIPLNILHGSLNIFGYRIGNLAYITDASAITVEAYEKIKDLDVLILNALRYKRHPTHFNLDQSVDESKKINASRTYFTHVCHDLDHDKVNSILPESLRLAYDGQEILVN